MKIQYKVIKVNIETLKESNYKLTINKEKIISSCVSENDNALFKLIRLYWNKELEEENVVDYSKKLGYRKALKKVLHDTNIKIKTESFNTDNGELISQLQDEKKKLESKLNNVTSKLFYKYQFINDLVFVKVAGHYDEFSKKEYSFPLQIIMSYGFVLNNIHYKYLVNSASMLKNNTLCFVNKKIYEPINDALMMGIEFDDNLVNLPKFTAYKGLVMSTCQFVEKMPYFIVVKDYKKIIPQQKVKTVIDGKFTDAGTNKIQKYKDIKQITEDVTINAFDGCGIVTKEVSEYISKALKLKHVPISWQVRLPYIKGMLNQAPIMEYAEETKEQYNYTLIDKYGNSHNLKEIYEKYDGMIAIINESMFKGDNYFSNWNTYLARIKKHNYRLGISKYNKPQNKLNLVCRYSYQFLQTLKLSTSAEKENSIIKLSKYSTDLVEKICSGDKLYTLLFWGIKDDIKRLSELDDKIQKAVALNYEMMKDEYVQQYLYKSIKSMVDEMKMGRIWIPNSTYEFIMPDVYAYLQFAFGDKEPSGLLKDGEFWSNGKVGEYAGSRAPLVTFSEHALMNFVDSTDNQKIKDYFGAIETGIICNIDSIFTTRVSDCDFDGDAIFCTDNKLYRDAIFREDAVYIQGSKPKPIEYTTKNVIDFTLDNMGNSIGLITNVISYYIQKLHDPDMFDKETKKPTKEWWKIRKRIDLGRYYQGSEIDAMKGCERNPLPYSWRKEASKTPYFMIFNREPNYIAKRKEYEKIVSENKKRKEKGKQEIELNISKYPSPMNTLAWYLEKWERKNIRWNDTAEDVSHLMMDKDILVDEKGETYKALKDIYKEFMERYKQYKTQELSNEQWGEFYNEYIHKCNVLCPDPQELANICVTICYKHNKSQSKKFCWVIAIDGILMNLELNKQEEIFIPVKCDKAEGEEYLGRYYKLEKKTISTEDTEEANIEYELDEANAWEKTQ